MEFERRGLIALGKKELEKIGLAKALDVKDGCVVRQKKAYPVYDDHYAKNVEIVRKEVEKNFPTLYPVGATAWTSTTTRTTR